LDASQRSLFQQSALSSGLLAQEEIDEAVAVVRAAQGTDLVGDDQLALQLVAQGRLNRWQAEQLLVGRTKFALGPYHILDSIGQGGMGQVFKAEHTIMGRVVAVKVLPRSKSTPEAIANFRHEIRAQAALDHPNLVRAFDAGHEGNVHFLVTEYVHGTDLRRLIRREGRLNMPAASAIISQAAEGLQHAHSRGLIHRDVKPGNLLVGNN
jgi:eukaryotic-like serine/threonine-protein kinase